LFEESLAIGEAQGDLDRRARALTNLGLAAAGLGDVARAHALFRQGLAAAAELGVVEVELHALLGVASCEADAAAAARLPGWMKDRQASLGGKAGAGDNATLEEQTLARLRDTLGPERLASELAAGAALSRAEALDLALGRARGGGLMTDPAAT